MSCLHHVKVRVRFLNHLKHNQVDLFLCTRARKIMPPRCECQVKVNSKQFTATFKVGNKIKTF